jgi:hypothetical protein
MYMRLPAQAGAGDPESTRELWLDFTWDLTALPAPNAGTGGDGGPVLPAGGALRLGERGGGAVVLTIRPDRFLETCQVYGK